MDKLENWITWGLLFAMLYQASKPREFAPACSSSTGTSWGVTDLLQSSSGGSQGLSGYNGGCNCG